MTTGQKSEINWSQTTWKGSRLQQHREHLALPFRRKMELLEEMCNFGRRTIERRKQLGLPYIDPRTDELVRPVKLGTPT